MNKHKTSKALVATLLLTIGSIGAPVAHAALNDRGGGLIYDSDLNITWLADANYADTSGYNTNGLMNWDAANTWAANLNYGGFDDWRLSTPSELGHLFYLELDGVRGHNIADTHNNANYDLFTNIESSTAYWTANSVDADRATAFSFFSGAEGVTNKAVGFYGWAVHPGDVALVPEPDTYAMILAGLGLVGFIVRRRKIA
jgi:hypothetical protein